MPLNKSVFLTLVVVGAGAGAWLPLSQQAPTYLEIAPILQTRCAPCHNPHGSAPFSLLTYLDAKRKSATIGYSVVTREMPPCSAKSEYGEFCRYSPLSEREILQIRRWDMAGAPRGKGPEPRPPSFAPKWQLGKPDRILKFKSVSVKTDADTYWQLYLSAPFSQAVQIRAFDVLPSNAKVLRQVQLAIVTSPTEVAAGKGNLGPKYSHVAGVWGDASKPWVLSNGGITIKAGARLAALCRFQSTGKHENGNFGIGLYLCKNRDEPSWLKIGSENFTVTENVFSRVSSSLQIKEAIQIYSIKPESLNATRVTLVGVDSAGKKHTLLNAAWGAAIAQAYNFRNPVTIPAGWTLVSQVEFFSGLLHEPPAPNAKKISYGYGADQDLAQILVQYSKLAQ